MPSGREESAVVLRDAEIVVALIDDPKQSSEVVVKVIRAAAEAPPAIEILGQPLLLTAQAVLEVVRVVDRQQAARLSVEAEEQAIEQHERVVEGVRERARSGGRRS